MLRSGVAIAFVTLGISSALAQGTINFSTRVPGQVDARVTYNGAPAGSAFVGQLFVASPGGTLIAVGNPRNFRNDAAIGYIAPGEVIAIPGVATGSSADVKLVAWNAALGATYDAVVGLGVGGYCESGVITVASTGGTGDPPTLPANLVGLQGCDIQDAPQGPSVPSVFSLPLGSGNPAQPGFRWRIHQVDPGGAGVLPNNNVRTENQLAGALGVNTADPFASGAAIGEGVPVSPATSPIEFAILGTINLSQIGGESHGRFFADRQMPGVPGLTGGTDNLAAEILTWLELRAGTYRLVVNSDDGFRLHLGGATPEDRFAPIFGEFSGGRGSADSTNTFRVTSDGVYAARITWEEGAVDANIEVFTFNVDNTPILLNEIGSGGLPAYRSVLSGLPAYATRVVPVPDDPAVDFDTPIYVEFIDGTNPDSTVDPGSIQLLLDGQAVTPVVIKTGSRTIVEYRPAIRLQPGGHSARLSYVAGVARVSDWRFTVAAYAILTPDLKVSPDISRPGLQFTVFQNSQNTENSSLRAEAAIAGQLEGPSGLLPNHANPANRGVANANGVRVRPGTHSPYRFEIIGTVNLNQNAASEGSGNFTPDGQMPGIPGTTGSNDGIAAEILAWVTLPAGAVTLGVNSDDGFLTHAGLVDNPTNRVFLGGFEHPDGRGAADTLFKFWVQEAGTYPLRTLWYEGVGGASVELFSVRTNGTKVLLNNVGAGGFPTYRPPADPPPPNQPPTLTAINTLTGAVVNTDFLIPYATLQSAANEADDDSASLSFRFEAGLSGTVTKNGAPVTPGTTLLGPGENWSWRPPAGDSGTLAAFTVRAFDGLAVSAPPVAVAVTVEAAANAPPSLAPIGSESTRSGVTLNLRLGVSDPDTPLETLVLVGKGADTNLVRNVTFGTTGPGQFVANVIPWAGRTGLTTVTIQVSDGSSIASQTFLFLVRSATDPIRIIEQPRGFTAFPGERRTLSVLADGADPLRYLWRRNGWAIRGATNSVFNFDAFQPEQGGTYSVLVYNNQGLVESDRVDVQAHVPIAGDLTDDWPPPSSVRVAEGYLKGSNSTADKQAGEPEHANTPGGHSVWFTWIPPSSGIATITSLGSGFDTVLAVYQGNPLDPNGRRRIVDNEDGEELGDHYFNSQVRFNARVDQRYEVAVDGFYGETGLLLVRFALEATAETVPMIQEQPKSYAKRPGTREVTFEVGLEAPFTLRHRFDWYRNGILVASGPSNRLVVGPVDATTIGQYHVNVFNGERVSRSTRAVLELTTYSPPRAALTRDDILVMPPLAIRLRRPLDPIATYLSSRLPDTTRTELDRWPPGTNVPPALDAMLVQDLNAVVQGPSIHEADRFVGVPLRAETRWYLERAQEADDIARLNRLLLEDAIPEAILGNREEGVVTQDKIQKAVRSPIAPRLQLAGRAAQAGVAGSAVPAFPGVPVRQLFTLTTADHTQLPEFDCGVVMDKTRWLELTTTQTGTLVADTLGSQIDTALILYRLYSLDPLEFATVECNHVAGVGESWSVLAARNLPAGTYYAQLDSRDQSGIVQFNWLLLQNDNAGVPLPHFGIHRLLANPAAARGGAPLIANQNDYLIRLTADPADDSARPWFLESMDAWPGPSDPVISNIVPTSPIGWLHLLSPPTAGTPGPRFFRSVRIPTEGSR